MIELRLIARCHLQHAAPVFRGPVALFTPVGIEEVQPRHRTAFVFEYQIHTIPLALVESHTDVFQYAPYLHRKQRHQAMPGLILRLRGMLQGTCQGVSPVIVLQGHVHLGFLQRPVGNGHHVAYLFYALLVNLV